MGTARWTRGFFWGDAAQSQDIYVNVEEADPGWRRRVPWNCRQMKA